jgi:hypothetical protein
MMLMLSILAHAGPIVCGKNDPVEASIRALLKRKNEESKTMDVGRPLHDAKKVCLEGSVLNKLKLVSDALYRANDSVRFYTTAEQDEVFLGIANKAKIVVVVGVDEVVVILHKEMRDIHLDAICTAADVLPLALAANLVCYTRTIRVTVTTIGATTTVHEMDTALAIDPVDPEAPRYRTLYNPPATGPSVAKLKHEISVLTGDKWHSLELFMQAPEVPEDGTETEKYEHVLPNCQGLQDGAVLCLLVTPEPTPMFVRKAYGWTGQQSSSGFSDLAPSILHYNWF